MPRTHCSRCGRAQQSDELSDIARLASDLSVGDAREQSAFGGPDPWASIDAANVCPQCQTPAEQRDVARRIVAAVEAEIGRTSSRDTDPTPHEAGLIAYAMRLRERLDTPPPPPEFAEPEPAETEPAGAELRVAITGAFLTGHPLRIRISEYDQLQRDLSRELGRQIGQGWSINSDHWRQDGTYYSGGGFTSMLPLILARRDGPDALARTTAVLRDRPDTEHAWLALETEGWILTPTSMRIDIYDLGMAVMNGTFSVRAPANLSLQMTARTLKRLVWLKPDPQTGVLSPITATFRKLADETTRQFETAIAAAAPHTVQQPWLSPFLDTLTDDHPPDRPRSNDSGRLLWLHPVYLLEVDDPDDLASSAAQLAPAFHRSIDIPDGRFAPGIGWSTLVTEPRPSSIDDPLRLIELHWAYIALYMEIDRGLLALLDNDRWHRTDSLAELEQDADHVFADYMRVMEARARVDSTLASLGGDEQAIWDVISDVTKFDALVSGVDRKVDVLQRVAERRVQQAAAAQARRTSAILSFLTALTIVTVAVALVTNFLGTRSDPIGHLEVRILIVVAALLASIGLYREAYRERLRPRRTHRRWRR
jgi:hypothetical protein